MTERYNNEPVSNRINVSKIREFFERYEKVAISKAKSTPNIWHTVDENENTSLNTTETNNTQSVPCYYVNLEDIEKANEGLDRWKSNRRSKYRKNDERQIMSSKRRMAQKSKSVIENVENNFGLSFAEAEYKGCTEEYRKSLICEMDLELEKMKNDGFIEDDSLQENIYENVLDEFSIGAVHNGFENLSTYANFGQEIFDLQPTESLQKEQELFSSDDTDTEDSKRSKSKSVGSQTDLTLIDDTRYTNEDFGWSSLLQDDQEEYFLEAYNKDGEELVMSYLEIVRKTVTPAENVAQFAAVVFESEEGTPDSSKRNTRYSTASADSCYSDRVDDEGIVVERRSKSDEDIVQGRRETITDDRGFVRIERFNTHLQRAASSKSVNDGEEGTNIDRDKGTLKYIFQEIIETEKKYVSDLQKVVKKYKPYVERNMPPAALGRACYIFGNIETIYRKQRLFLKELDACSNVKCIVEKFIDNDDLFKLYPQYFKNKPRADATLKEYAKVVRRRQRELDDRLDISAYLLTPLQRLSKYKLFLENIQKYFEKNQEDTVRVQVALKMIRNELQKGNDLLAIESIVENPLERFVYGSFIRREKFVCVKPRKMEVVVFLFQEIVILTIENQNQRNIEEFQYWTSINMRDLRIATYENDLSIHLTDFSKSKRKFTLSTKYTIILEAKDEKCKEMWRKDIENILWKQLEQAKVKTINEFKKNPKVAQETKRNRAKSTGSSTFYTFN